ncbi:MAG TPA: PQQ-binding-like beta-propeller repeat protein [Tepidisphaeraceae bacterium]|nr:PQQ-binding-like beta-propeller repeat protein [Tepidisphaeraceae bacterium]
MSRAPTRPAYIGIQGTVLCLDRASGQQLWRTKLKGYNFVNVILDGSDLFASTRGEMFCLDAVTGRVRWNNRLKGLGRGLVSIATADRRPDTAALLAEHVRQEEAAAAAAAGAAGGAGA